MTNATKHLLAAVSIVLAILVGEQAWTPIFCLKIFDMDSVQVGGFIQ